MLCYNISLRVIRGGALRSGILYTDSDPDYVGEGMASFPRRCAGSNLAFCVTACAAAKQDRPAVETIFRFSAACAAAKGFPDFCPLRPAFLSCLCGSEVHPPPDRPPGQFLSCLCGSEDFAYLYDLEQAFSAACAAAKEPEYTASTRTFFSAACAAAKASSRCQVSRSIFSAACAAAKSQGPFLPSL